VLFVDREHLPRYEHVIPSWSKTTSQIVARRRFEHERKLAVWTRRDALPEDVNVHIAELHRIFGAGPFTIPAVDIFSWNGLNLKAPMMVLGDTSQLGVLGADSAGRPRLSFALADRPYCGDPWFYTQHLIISLSFVGGLYGDDLHTLNPPYIPELNEFYARTMHFEYSKFRVEPERIGLVVDAADTDAFVSALPVADLMQRIFKLAGFKASPSSWGPHCASAHLAVRRPARRRCLQDSRSATTTSDLRTVGSVYSKRRFDPDRRKRPGQS